MNIFDRLCCLDFRFPSLLRVVVGGGVVVVVVEVVVAVVESFQFRFHL